MKDALTWEDVHLLDYINDVEYLYVPYIDDYKYGINIEVGNPQTTSAKKIPTPMFGYSEICSIFMDRYNEGKLSKQHQYDKFTKAFSALLTELELDIDKFWCLYLFAFDYCENLYYNGVTMKATPLEQLQALINAIDNGDSESTELELRNGKQRIFVKSSTALHFVADAISKMISESDDSTIKSLYIREQDEVNIIPKDSPIIAYFAKIILAFFNTKDHIISKRKKGAKHSLKEKDIVGKLVYMSKLSDNENWTNVENDMLNPFLRQYEDYRYPNNVSSIYPEFLVY